MIPCGVVLVAVLAKPDKVMGVVLLCALSLNAVYVAKWAFMCPLCGLKRARLGLFWGHFRCFRGPQVPMCVDSAWECPGMGFEAFVSAALEILPSMTSIRRIWHLFASFTWD